MCILRRKLHAMQGTTLLPLPAPFHDFTVCSIDPLPWVTGLSGLLFALGTAQQYIIVKLVGKKLACEVSKDSQIQELMVFYFFSL